MKKKSKKGRFSIIETKWDGNPRFEAYRFVAFYIVISVIWIVTSDKLLESMVDDVTLLTTLQIIKGWLFVFSSGALFYLILKARLNLIQSLTNEMIHQVTFDKLTSIPTKEEFARLINQKIKTSPDDERFALVRLDVDNFSNINELLDYEVGDQLLVELKNSIRSMLHRNDVMGRDGDGFVFSISYTSVTEYKIRDVLDQIMARVNSIWHIDKHDLYMTCSMGVALFPKDGLTFLQLYKASDIVMNHVKETEKNGYIFFEEDFILKRFDKINMINELRKALENQEMYLMYQPIFTMNKQYVVGFEALLRWENHIYGKVSPAQFIQYSENIGMIVEIEKWVFDKAMNLRKTWMEMGDHDTMLAINLSSKGLASPSFIMYIKDLYRRYELKKHQIQIEVTETAIIKNMEQAIKHLKQLQEIGCLISLDDFGSGYSSLTYLQKLPIDMLKIDSRFTSKIGTDTKDDMILEAIIDLARKLELKTIVEGIETSHQFNYLQNLNCDYGQGFYLSIPIEEAKMMQHITKNKQLVQ